MSSDLSSVPLSTLHPQQQQQQQHQQRGSNDASARHAAAGHQQTHLDPRIYEYLSADPATGYDDALSDSATTAAGPSRQGTGKWSGRPSRGFDDSSQQEELESPQLPFASESRGRGGQRGGPSGGHSRASSIAESSGDETEDFAWNTSDEEDDEEDGKEAGAGGRSAKIRAKRGRKVYLFCMRLARPVRIFLVGFILCVLCLVPLFVALFAIDSSNNARPHVQSWSIWFAIIVATSAVTFILLDFLPPVILRLAIAVYGRAPEIFKSYLEVAMSTLIYVKLLLCVAWAWIALGGVNAGVWKGIPGGRPEYFVWVERAVKAIFATAVILAAEKFAMHAIGVNFHKEAIRDRLVENQKALKYLDKLYDSKYIKEDGGFNSKRQSGTWARMGFGAGSRPMSPSAANALGQQGYFPHQNVGTVDPAAAEAYRNEEDSGYNSAKMYKQNSQSASTDHMRKAKADRKANFATQLQDALATATMKDSKLFKTDRGYGSQQSARRLAKKLFTNLGRHRKTLVATDFIPYFKSEAEAHEAFGLFDKDNNGDIDKSEMRDAVQRIYRERRAINTSLKDMTSALKKLDMVLLFIGLIITIFIWLLIFSPTTTVASLVPLSTIIVGFSFVFGSSAKEIFESMIFLIVTHPYDCGDLVMIDDTWLFVVEFGLLSTTFKTTTNQTVIAPNSLLSASKFIHNSRRSGNTWEVTMLQLAFDTPLQSIDALRSRMREWVKENDREWGGGMEINYNTITNLNALEVIVAFEHKGNWQNWGERWARRTKLIRQIKIFTDDLGITYCLPPQPVTFQQRPQGSNNPFSRYSGNQFRGQGSVSGGLSGGSGGSGGGMMGAGSAGGPGGQGSSFAGLPGVGGVGSNFGLNKPSSDDK